MKFFSFSKKGKPEQIVEEPAPKMNVRRVYLDYASISPIDPDVLNVMRPYTEKHFFNPSSLYSAGVENKRAIEAARKSIASHLNVQADEVVFTGSGTESNNLAILGVFNAYTGKERPHIITSAIEHPSIIETCKEVERMGGKVTYISPDRNGLIDPKKVKSAIKKSTILVSIMYANNEIGTIQQVGTIGRMIQEYREKNKYPYFHTDASQAANYLPVHIGQLGADMVTLDAGKIYGPRGIGALAVKKNVIINPILFGGGQEKGLRAGTENVPAIIGFAKAMQMAEDMREREGERVFDLQHYLHEEIKKRFPDAIVHGEEAPRLPNILNICFPGLDAEFAVIKLDQEGIAASSASACQSNSDDNFSQTVAALPDIGEECKRSSLRFSMGRNTERGDIERLLVVLERILGSTN